MTASTSMRHPFIYTWSETKELVMAFGAENAGVQLGRYHWFIAEESQADILT